MPVEFTSLQAGPDQGSQLFGTRMEAATEALLRARDHVISTLDRQVAELQQLHRALACAPAPLIMAEEPAPAPASALPAMVRPNVFEQAPMFPAAFQTPPAAPPSGMFSNPTVAMGFSPVAAEVSLEVREAVFDPALERATLDELNDALASAFASVSVRARN